jgi:Protein of unknown function (DUF2637)
VNAGREQGHRWTAPALAIVLLAVEAVIVAESWRGLTGFAHLIGITGRAAWGVPVTLDGVSLVAALTALRAELAGEASGVYRGTLFAFTAASATANWWHGTRQGGIEAALYLGGMSIAVTVVFALVLRQIRHEEIRKAGRATTPLPKFSFAHWLRFPRLTFRAWSLAIRDGHESPRVALDAALSGRSADRHGTASGPRAQAVIRTGSQTGPGTGSAVDGQTGLTAIVGPARPALPGPVPDGAGGPVPGGDRKPVRRTRPNRSGKRNANRSSGATAEDAETEFAAEIAAGKVPTIYQIRNRLHVGNEKAKVLRQHIARQALST